MRSYMPVFCGGGDLPPEVFARWHTWSRQYESVWRTVVAANMRDGNLDDGDPVIATRLILGMLIWVSRWYRPKDKITPAQIAEAAIQLVRVSHGSPTAKGRNQGASRKRSSAARTR
jgi:Tetracyclin repressor-like, C-terminal domain